MLSQFHSVVLPLHVVPGHWDGPIRWWCRSKLSDQDEDDLAKLVSFPKLGPMSSDLDLGLQGLASTTKTWIWVWRGLVVVGMLQRTRRSRCARGARDEGWGRGMV